MTRVSLKTSRSPASQQRGQVAEDAVDRLPRRGHRAGATRCARRAGCWAISSGGSAKSKSARVKVAWRCRLDRPDESERGGGRIVPRCAAPDDNRRHARRRAREVGPAAGDAQARPACATSTSRCTCRCATRTRPASRAWPTRARARRRRSRPRSPTAEVEFRPRRQLRRAAVDDGSDDLVLRFLNFYPSQQKTLAAGARVRVRGELRGGFLGREMVHPVVQAGRRPPLPTALTPVYPTSAQLPQAYLRKAVAVGAGARGAARGAAAGRGCPPACRACTTRCSCCTSRRPDAPLATLEDRSHPAWQRLKFEELLAQQLSQLQAQRERALLRAPALAAAARRPARTAAGGAAVRADRGAAARRRRDRRRPGARPARCTACCRATSARARRWWRRSPRRSPSTPAGNAR